MFFVIFWNRFAKEIESCSVTPAPVSSVLNAGTISRGPSIIKPAFIPNSIRRQMPVAAPELVKPTVQATFVPAVSSQASSNQSSSQSNYTVTPMEMPSFVHNVGKVKNSNTVNPGGVTKAKNNDKKGLFLF